MGVRAHHGHEVDPGHSFEMCSAQARGDAGTEVAAVRDVTVVSEPGHEAVPQLGRRDLAGCRGLLVGERESGQGRHDDVMAEVGESMGERDHLGEGARPAIRGHDR